MHNSTEYEILFTHKFPLLKRNSKLLFLLLNPHCSVRIMLIIVEMPTIVGILTFIGRIKNDAQLC